MADHTHPVTPPPELRQLWAQQAQRMDPHDPVACLEHIVTQAVRWGADQELRACHELLDVNGCPSKWLDMLRAARRPKPPSLAEQALDAAEDMSDCMNDGFVPNRSSLDTIRRALERLKELEQQENNDN